MALQTLDWIIIIAYLCGMIMLSFYLARSQKSERDYYLGGNSTGAFPIAISTMATQCSTNSILGAPAFVAFSVGGGLVWLQYELALPLAMIFLMHYLLPIYRKLNIISVYSYLEKRFGRGTRLTLSLLFQFLRAFTTGVTVYGISLVIQYCMGIPFWTAVILLGVITIVYDSIGGMKAVIYSDVIQMGVLYTSILLIMFLAIDKVGGIDQVIALNNNQRLAALDFKSLGLDGADFSFWPMMIGGFFLYISYYGCDQTQVQRELSTKSMDDTNMSLFINGILRFPLVLSYCLLGVCIAAYAAQNPDFLSMLPLTETNTPNYNLAVPVFVIKYFPVGLVGLVMVGLFSAAMSSLDSTINSLSATTMEDVIKGHLGISLNMKQELFYSKVLTVFWGSLCTIFSFYVGDIADSIIVSINKVGSLINGPILAVFVVGIFTKRVSGTSVLIGFFSGFISNFLLWIFAPQISWLWWNFTGFAFSIVMAILAAKLGAENTKDVNHLIWSKENESHFGYKVNWSKYYKVLGVYAAIIFFVMLGFGYRS